MSFDVGIFVILPPAAASIHSLFTPVGSVVGISDAFYVEIVVDGFQVEDSRFAV